MDYGRIMEAEISYLEVASRLFLSAVLSGLIGIERERASWFAGLRTHMLVCIGSTLIMIVSQHGFYDVLYRELVVLDPSRVAAQVISGIGFLGAGTILFWKNKIRGLTTAASLWAVAGVGLAVGGGLYIASISATILILIILALIKPFEEFLHKKSHSKEIKISFKSGISFTPIEEVLQLMQAKDALMSLQVKKENQHAVAYFYFKKDVDINLLKIGEELSKMTEINNVEVTK